MQRAVSTQIAGKTSGLQYSQSRLTSSAERLHHPVKHFASGAPRQRGAAVLRERVCVQDFRVCHRAERPLVPSAFRVQRRHNLAHAVRAAQQTRNDNARLRQRHRVLTAYLAERSCGPVAADDAVRRRRADIRLCPRGKTAVIREIRPLGRRYAQSSRRHRHRDKFAPRDRLRRAEQRRVPDAFALHDALSREAERRVVRRVALHVGVGQPDPVLRDFHDDFCRFGHVSLRIDRRVGETVGSYVLAGRVEERIVFNFRQAEARPLGQLKEHDFRIRVFHAERAAG